MTIKSVRDLSVKIFADGADKEGILKQYANPIIKGFTTNPTLMRKAGIADYETFARDIASHIRDRHLSFEVFSDEFDEMYEQARKIGSWAQNIYVKVPITNTRGESSVPLLRRLAQTGVKLNVTAIFTESQVQSVSDALAESAPCCISVFAGRIADAGVDPVPIMRNAVRILARYRHQELIWASPREVLNIVQANDVGCHIITVTQDLLAKLGSLGKDLDAFSLETVRMFRTDAVAAGFKIA
jgi:transaldolase